MEQLLIKLARQLDALDEASFSALWEKYAAQVQNFEPTERWQEAVLIFSFIQAKQWKNRLFNTLWAERVRPFPSNAGQTGQGMQTELNSYVEDALRSTREAERPRQKKAKVLPFVMPKHGEQEPDNRTDESETER